MYEDVNQKNLAIIRTFDDDPSTVGICFQSNRYKTFYFSIIFIFERSNISFFSIKWFHIVFETLMWRFKKAESVLPNATNFIAYRLVTLAKI
jgi:hypothetical protein